MKSIAAKKTPIRVVVVDSDPLRCVGFRACLSSESDFEIHLSSPFEFQNVSEADIILLSSHMGNNVAELLSNFKARRNGLKCLVTGCNMSEETMLRLISAGARGCVDESFNGSELIRAIRIVHEGMVWAPRRVLASFVERTYNSGGPGVSPGQRPLTSREKEVLRMLVAGCSNKEIAAPLGIEERTVKAHVAKLMRKVGVPNRILLSVHAISHSLVHV